MDEVLDRWTAQLFEVAHFRKPTPQDTEEQHNRSAGSDIDNVGTVAAKYPASYQKRFFLARSPTVFSTNGQVMSSVTQTSSVQ
ncbi:hypothetical protein L914_12067 [Phytophthora nicotianae]|uniref:Uncharacterized protein n=1 Tax=Phytophthora nicotianae TaxID=4792 RepID=W2N0R9_PHYNI|nr:hypothetical protein L914_12067 [Phytophthora nicotianae]